MSINPKRFVLILYRRILTLHRGLPQEMKIVGDGYVRDEFKRHKTVNDAEARVFIAEWTRYFLTLADQLSPKGIAEGRLGEYLKPEDVTRLSDEQIRQLYELKVESEKPKIT